MKLTCRVQRALSPFVREQPKGGVTVAFSLEILKNDNCTYSYVGDDAVFIELVGFSPPCYILMPVINTRKQPLAIPTLLVLMSKSHCMTLPVLSLLWWL